ncbi:MAG: polysaccharide deacetylase family protein [Bacteroidota bacterium]
MKMMRFYSPPPLLKRFTGKYLYWQIKTSEKKVFLTFDDGPTPYITEQVLEILKQFKAKASFFCLGKNILLYPQIYQQILAEGHLIGNHTMNHLNGWKTNNQEYLKDIYAMDAIQTSGFFRPPYGKISLWQIRNILPTHKIIMWSLLTYDFAPIGNPAKSLKNICRRIKPGSVVVMHDSKKAAQNCLKLLPGILEYCTKEGFLCERIDASLT